MLHAPLFSKTAKELERCGVPWIRVCSRTSSMGRRPNRPGRSRPLPVAEKGISSWVSRRINRCQSQGCLRIPGRLSRLCFLQVMCSIHGPLARFKKSPPKPKRCWLVWSSCRLPLCPHVRCSFPGRRRCPKSSKSNSRRRLRVLVDPSCGVGGCILTALWRLQARDETALRSLQQLPGTERTSKVLKERCRMVQTCVVL